MNILWYNLPDGIIADLYQQNSFQIEDSMSSFHPSDVRYIRSNAPPPSSGAPHTITSSNSDHQYVESVPGIDLFGAGWLQDPNCVGSSVAAMGQESSDLIGWNELGTEPSGRSVPRSRPEPAYEQNDYYDHPLDPGDYQINSEQYLAAHLLYAIHRGDEDS